MATRNLHGVSKPFTAPPKDELYRLIHVDHLTYKEVGDLFGVDHTAISYWLKRLGLPMGTAEMSHFRGNPPTLTPEQAAERYAAGESAAAIAHSAGFKSKTTVLRMLEEAGVKRRAQGWRPGRELLASDGTRVRSTYELRVADWLIFRRVPYEYEPLLPFGHHRSRADFLVNGWYVEVWGVHSKPSYAKRKAWKKRMYGLHALPLIELSPHHFSRDKHILERRLRRTLEVA